MAQRKQPPVVKQQPKDVDEQFKGAQQKMLKEVPDLAQGDSVTSYGPLAKMFMSGAYAFTNPLTGSIYYNKEKNLGQSDEEVADTLRHELEHRKQVMGRSGPERVGVLLRSLLPAGDAYQQRPDEINAFNAQVQRAVGQGRSTVAPAFDTGVDYPHSDIALRSPKKKH